MIKSFFHRLLGKDNVPAARRAQGRRVEVPAEQHGIDARLVDERAVQVVTTLKNAGHEAYIVGGAVRDLLVGRAPKDFDVATDATPEEVKALFRRAFIIGRRFRIVHVIFGRGREHEVIEVSTFRAQLESGAAQTVSGNERTAKHQLAGMNHAVDASGRVLRDNVWGPQIEDAARRDFTINAMYYDPTTRVVVDYHGGLADVKARVLRMIGDPATRYAEDPVRLLRVVRFAAKLGFSIEPHTRKPMAQAATLLSGVPASRLFDEMFKLLQTGHALASVAALKSFGLTPVFPILQQALAHPPESAAARFVELALADTDRRVGEGKPVAPSFLLACLLWDEVQQRWAQARSRGEAPHPALQQAVDAVFDARVGDISGRGKLGSDMREIWQMQPRFERRSGSGPASLVEQARFRAGFDFLRLRADVGEVSAELAEWWEDFSLGSEDERTALLAAVREQSRPAKRVSRAAKPTARSEDEDVRFSRPAPAADDEAEPAQDELFESTGDAAAKRRRRRRRRSGPGGSGGGSAGEGGAPAP